MPWGSIDDSHLGQKQYHMVVGQENYKVWLSQRC